MHLVFTGGTGQPLGNGWRIVAKKRDFYVEPLGDSTSSPFHISAHGPQGRHINHRFHIRVDEANFHQRGLIYNHSIPKGGAEFTGKKIADDAYHILRLRWTWHLGRPRYVRHYSPDYPLTQTLDADQAYKMDKPLEVNEVWDVDLIASYHRPYMPHMGAFWPDASRTAPPARFGPILNAAGMYLTGTSYRRTETRFKTPRRVNPPLPRKGQTPNRILVGGSDHEGLYWLNQTITSLDIITGDKDYVYAEWPAYSTAEI